MANHPQTIPRFFIAAVILLLGLFPHAGHSQSLADALDTTNLVWTTGGDAAWFAQTTNTHDGVDAVRSGVIVSNETSWIETTVVGPATLKYWLGVFPGDHPSRLNIIWNNDNSEQQAVPWRSTPYWMEPLSDLPAGPQSIRWLVSNPPDATNPGYAILDELQVLPPRPLSFSYQSGDSEVHSGGWIFLSASVIGTPPFQYQWRKEEVNIPGATNAHLEFAAANTNHSGSYSLVVSNSQGFIVSSNFLLTVLPSTPPFFTYEPASATGYAGQLLYLGGSVSGSLPIHFQWRQNGTNLGELTPTIPWWGSASLILTNLSAADAGNYTLFVTNDYGSIESSNAVLTVIPSVAPVITKHPRSLEVAEGVNTWMSVAATGDPSPTFKWTKVGDVPPPPPPGPPPPPIISQPSQPTRSFTNAMPADAGVYFATAKTFGGEVNSRAALLTVLPPISLASSFPQQAVRIFATNQLAFLAQGAAGLSILSVSNPTTPVVLGSYDTPGYASAVQVAGPWAYVADGVGLKIFSVTNPSSPTLIGSYNTPYSATDVVVRSNLAYVANGNAGLLILSVSNAAAPLLLGSYATNMSPHHLAVAGNNAYLTSLQPMQGPGENSWVGGLLIVDISNPVHPTEVGRINGSFTRVAARDDLVFVTGGSGLSIIDVHNPATPQSIGGFDSYGASFTRIPVADLQLAGDRVYLVGNVNSNSMVLVLDIRDPSEPIPVGYYPAPGLDHALAVESHRVYTAGDDQIFKLITTPFTATAEQPPSLTISVANGMQLWIHGQRGRNYDLEGSTSFLGQSWQPLCTLLLTNVPSSVTVTQSVDAQFFRLKQLD